MNEFVFAPATREAAMARIALQGPGGSGKTKTALLMAEELAQGGLVGLIDTERESAKKYAPVPGRPHLGGHVFRHLPMTVCTPENFLKGIEAAKKAGIYVLIVDSWSHYWAGKGGLLARVDEESQKGDHKGGKFSAWGPVNDLEQDMLDALLNYPGHVICTMRTKNDYDLTNGKVTKIGVKTVQRDGAEYEFDVVVDMIRGTGTVTKTRYEPLDELSVYHPGHEFAATILEQLGQGVDPIQVIVDGLAADGVTLDQVLDFQGVAARRGFLQAAVDNGESDATTLGALLTDALGEVVSGIVDADGFTYAAALALHQRAKAGGWLDVETIDHGTGEMTTIGEVIRARGVELKPVTDPAAPAPAAVPNAAPATADEADSAAGNEPEHDGSAEDYEAAVNGAEDYEDTAEEDEADTQSGREAGIDGWHEPVPSPAPAASAPAPVPAPATPAPTPAVPAPARDQGEAITAPQMRKVFAQFRDLGLADDRDRRLTAVSLLIGRKVSTMNALNFGEGSELIDILDGFDSPEVFRARLNELLTAAKNQAA